MLEVKFKNVVCLFCAANNIMDMNKFVQIYTTKKIESWTKNSLDFC